MTARYKRWVSELYGTTHYTPIPPSWEREATEPVVILSEISRIVESLADCVAPPGAREPYVAAAAVPFETLDAGEYEIVAPAGCHAAGVLRRKESQRDD